jgi:hypothetical protein
MSTRSRARGHAPRQASEPCISTSALGEGETERTPLLQASTSASHPGLTASSSATSTAANSANDLEARWSRWKSKVARFAQGKRRAREDEEPLEPRLLVSVFDGALPPGVEEAQEEEQAEAGISEKELWQ